MSAILGPGIGRRRRSRSPPPRSGTISRSISISPPPFGRRGSRRNVPIRMGPPMSPPPSVRPQKKQQAPQDAIDEFWTKFTTKTPGKATRVIPQNQFVDRVARETAQGTEADGTSTSATVSSSASGTNRTTGTSYEDAAAMCRAKVAKIVKECRRVNKKYRDPHFDLESDLKLGRRDTLESLGNIRGARKPPGSDFCPRSAKRVTEIFDKPQFYIEGPTANDVRQGRDGDCWLMSALCTLSNKKGLIERLCVAHDQAVGVYGFVFHRDGAWISEIVDDFLYLTKSDYDESYTDRVLFDECERVNPEEAYRRIYQSNSGSLYFAQCEHPQETWLPLLEKCYAKAHGDYAAIEGGFGGEGIEDLTGGVTSEIFTTDILDKEQFWSELLRVNQEFLFGCSTGVWGESTWGERKGIMERHSYSVQRAVDIEGKRLVRLKNPWGKGEWKGPWSDGSKEWTPEWLEKLGHRFGDDGDFWIAYDDLLRKYQAFERTRLFGNEWSITQIWTTLNVPWMVNYHDTYFTLTIAKPGPVVLVLSQLDDRYFRGLEGQYRFELGFRLHKAGHEDYIVRSQTPYRMRRSVNVELDLEAGDYDVRIKIDACRYEDLLPIEQVVRENAKDCREKLTRIGLAYDLAHGKGKVLETPEEKSAREAHEKKQKEKERQKMKKQIQTNREEQHYLKKKQYERDVERQRKVQKQRKAKVAEMDAKRRAAGMPSRGGPPHLMPRHAMNGRGRRRPGRSPGPIADEMRAEMRPETPAETPVETPAETTPAEATPTGTETTNEEPKDVPPQHDAAKPADERRAEPPREMPPQERSPAPGHERRLPPQPRRQVRHGRALAPPPMDSEGDFSEDPVEDGCESESEACFDDFDSLSELSDRELDLQVDMRMDNIRRMQNNQPPPPREGPEEEPDEFERDPWNAVAVVGLRVYHKSTPSDADGAQEDAVKLKVVRPNPYATGDDVDEEERKSKELDVDDSAKDATLVGGVTDRKKSIMGNNRKPS
ncbi:epoxide hydrolase 1 [Purpureocillium lavendulum]|uniref:Epoxide hydrolase 1 n=1 Tax=Purpureocillium lavendulum TaxID=1247861 RepID=A0AB34FXJ0_9HYPO|nr:epoxide hydrolase 1 [Purpureocillium lavendulum]